MSAYLYNKTQALKFWCQKTLPLVYDDSLSYYELLAKVVKYLNSTTEDVRTLIQEVEDIATDLSNVAIIDDTQVSPDYVWSSKKCSDTFPVINNTGSSGTSVWSSAHTGTMIDQKIAQSINNQRTSGLLETYNCNYLNYELDRRVVVEAGKGLSTNDYTNADKAIVDGVTSALAGKIDSTEKGATNGVATLGGDGKVPSSQLPSYVDDVVEYASVSAFPATGSSGVIYVALDTNKTYRWSGSEYVEISASLALGETVGTAYEGSKGKANADNIATLQGYVPSDTSSSNKLVNASELSIGLNGKVDKVSGKGLSTNDYTNADKTIVDGVTSALAQKISRSQIPDGGYLYFDAITDELRIRVGDVNISDARLVTGASVSSALLTKLGWTDFKQIGAFNLNGTNYKSNTSHGITWTIESDGTIDAYGTSPADGNSFPIQDEFVAPLTDYVVLTGCNSGISSINLYPWDLTDDARPYADDTMTTRLTSTDNVYDNNEVTFYMIKGHKYGMYCRVMQGYTPNHVKYKPMLRLYNSIYSADSSVYEPYSMTNHQLTANVIELQDEVGHVGKNLLPNKAKSTGIFTVNSNGSITANGTTTELASIAVNTDILLPAGEYILTSETTTSADYKTFLGISGSATDVGSVVEGGLRFTTNGTTHYRVAIVVYANKTLSNVRFYPMIRPANIEDATYYPYRMGLTDISKLVAPFDMKVIPYNEDLNNYYTEGVYTCLDASHASTISNKPNVSVSAGFRLEVKKINTNTDAVIQTLYFNTTPQLYCMRYADYQHNFGNWIKYEGTTVT